MQLESVPRGACVYSRGHRHLVKQQSRVYPPSHALPTSGGRSLLCPTIRCTGCMDSLVDRWQTRTCCTATEISNQLHMQPQRCCCGECAQTWTQNLLSIGMRNIAHTGTSCVQCGKSLLKLMITGGEPSMGQTWRRCEPIPQMAIAAWTGLGILQPFSPPQPLIHRPPCTGSVCSCCAAPCKPPIAVPIQALTAPFLLDSASDEQALCLEAKGTLPPHKGPMGARCLPATGNHC